MISHVPVPPLDPTSLDHLPRRYVLESNTTSDPDDGTLHLGNAALGDGRRVAL